MIKKILPKKKKQEEQLPARITNDTVAQHREKVLAGGRKLKYPRQYTKHTLVRNTIIISLAGLLLLAMLIWLQLYVWKDTSDWAYRVTRVAPLPVAKIDGEYVRYSDYLLYHRSSVALSENKGKTGDNFSSDRMQFQQQQAMYRALEDAYAKKIAREKGITLASDERTDELIEQHRKDTGLPKASYASAISDSLRWSMDEVRIAMRNTILRQDVAFAVDDAALEVSDEVAKLLGNGSTLEDVAKTVGSAAEYQAGITVPKDNSDGGLSSAAAKLDIGVVSPATKTLAGDGYYFIVRQASADDVVSYSYLKVPLTVFAKKFADLKDDASTELFINIK